MASEPIKQNEVVNEQLGLDIETSDHAATSADEGAAIDNQEGASPTSESETSEPTSPSPLIDRIGKVFIVECADCAPFQGAARAGTAYNAARDFELREDILARGVVEAIVLLDGTKPYPILSGNRRSAVVTQLQSEGHAILLPARLATFTPMEAVAFAAAQNVGRLQPTAVEQARTVAWTLANVEENQARVGEALAMAEAKVSRLALLAALPAWVLEVVTDPTALSENFAGVLQKPLGQPGVVKTMKRRAIKLKNSNRTLAGPAAARYLVTGHLEFDAVDVLDKAGVRYATLKADIRGGLTVRIPPASSKPDVDVDTIHGMIAASLLTAMKQRSGSTKEVAA